MVEEDVGLAWVTVPRRGGAAQVTVDDIDGIVEFPARLHGVRMASCSGSFSGQGQGVAPVGRNVDVAAFAKPMVAADTFTRPGWRSGIPGGCAARILADADGIWKEFPAAPLIPSRPRLAFSVSRLVSRLRVRGSLRGLQSAAD